MVIIEVDERPRQGSLSTRVEGETRRQLEAKAEADLRDLADERRHGGAGCRHLVSKTGESTRIETRGFEAREGRGGE